MIEGGDDGSHGGDAVTGLSGDDTIRQARAAHHRGYDEPQWRRAGRAQSQLLHGAQDDAGFVLQGGQATGRARLRHSRG